MQRHSCENYRSVSWKHRRRGGGVGGEGSREREREHRPTAQCQLLAGPQLQWMWSFQSRGFAHFSHTHSHTHWDCLHGVGLCVCVCVLKGDIKPCLAEAVQNRSPHCDWQTSGSFREKHMAPSVLQFGRCLKHDWGPGRWAGGRQPPPRSVLSWVENPATGLLSQRVIVHDDDDNLSLSPFSVLSQSITLLSLDPLLLPLCRCLSHIPLTSPLSCSSQLSQEVCVKRLYLRGAVKQRKAGEWMGKIAPLISTKFDFSFTWWDVRCETPSLLLYSSLPLCFDLFFLNSVFIAFSTSLWLSSLFLSFPCLPVRLSGILPRLFEDEQ